MSFLHGGRRGGGWPAGGCRRRSGGVLHRHGDGRLHGAPRASVQGDGDLPCLLLNRTEKGSAYIKNLFLFWYFYVKIKATSHGVTQWRYYRPAVRAIVLCKYSNTVAQMGHREVKWSPCVSPPPPPPPPSRAAMDENKSIRKATRCAFPGGRSIFMVCKGGGGAGCK